MSRIGRKPITVPDKVTIAVKDGVCSVGGPLGNLTVKFKPAVKVTWTESEKSVVVTVSEADLAKPGVAALWGSTRALIACAVEGVTKGYQKDMEIVGVGWSATITGPKLKLVVGYAHPVMMDIPKELKVALDEKNKQIVRVFGADKQMVGQFAATMRAARKPEPYNGKGVKYLTEVIKRKSGKAFGAA